MLPHLELLHLHFSDGDPFTSRSDLRQSKRTLQSWRSWFKLRCKTEQEPPAVYFLFAVHFSQPPFSFPGRWRWIWGELCSTKFLSAPVGEAIDSEGATAPAQRGLHRLKEWLTSLIQLYTAAGWCVFVWSCSVFTVVDTQKKSSFEEITQQWRWELMQKLILTKFCDLSARV